MTAATKDVKSDQYSTRAIPDLYQLPVAASTLIYGGTIVASDSSGNAIRGSANNALKIIGRAESQVDNSSGSAGDKTINVRSGVFFFNIGTGSDVISNSNRFAYVYVVDDNTVGLTDAGGTRPLAGYVVDVPASGTMEFGKVAVALGMARPDALNPELAGTASTAYKARAVATSLTTYVAALGVLTGNATGAGALGSQDGVSLVAGDILFVPEGLSRVTAADAGPYTVTNTGITTVGYVLTRPDWWAHGAAVVPGNVVQIGGEGTAWLGGAWKSFAAKGKVIGTDAPALYPDFYCQSVTLAAGLITMNAAPILSATKSMIEVMRTAVGGTVTTTVQYQPTVITPGILNTASLQIAAQTSTGATDTADTSTLSIAIHNW
jgi:hypothetical protein